MFNIQYNYYIYVKKLSLNEFVFSDIADYEKNYEKSIISKHLSEYDYHYNHGTYVYIKVFKPGNKNIYN